MASLTLDDRLIWFAHCPKAGGTSVERFMVDHWGTAVGHIHWGWDIWWKGGGWRRADPPNSPQHLIWADAQGALPRAPDAVFAVVRDPLSRLISEYRYQGQARRGTRAGRGLAHLPFATWLRLMLALAARNPYAFDNHLRPQADFVPPQAHVFHLENGMTPVRDWLTAHAGRAQPDAHIPQELRARPGTGPRLYAEDIRLIARVFATDYARFGYAPPDPGAYARDPWAGLRGAAVRALLPALATLERCAKL